jgi:uncharacterized protein YbaA (DUF1428 family)
MCSGYPACALSNPISSGRPTGLQTWGIIPATNNQRKETEMAYVDGFVVPVPKDRVDEYRRMARKAGKVWREHGALEYRECVADDVNPGKVTSFPRSVKAKPDETVVFAYIVYRSRAHRDRVLAKVMKDPFMTGGDQKSMPFDMKRMFFGGFKVIVDA